MQTSNPSSSTRELLLQTGMSLARVTGLRKLTVRGLAAHAGVNPGSFVYHFGNRNAFISELIETWYQPLFAELRLRSDQTRAPVARLRALILQLVDFALEHRVFAMQLLQDVAAGEPAASQFVLSLRQRHPVLLVQAIEQAQQEGALVAGHPVQLLMFLMPPLVAPLWVAEVSGTLAALPPEWLALCTQFAYDRTCIEQRLDWALQGLTQAGRR